MPRFKITRSRKAAGGRRIIAVYGPSMGYQTVGKVASKIRAGESRYYVREESWEADVRVVEEHGTDRLVSTKDVFSPNNLSNLPDC